MKRIVLLGSTGSIGRNTLDVVSRHAGDFEIVGLAARRNYQALAAQCEAHPEALFALTSQGELDEMCRVHPGLRAHAVGTGEAGLEELIQRAAPDLVLNALVGVVGLRPTMAALSRGIPVAIANKETIVTGGELLLEAARRGGSHLIPIDSEHVAISQCLGEEPREAVERIVITASGGALRDRPLESLADVTVEEVLDHPTWDMGDKITVDSATLMNKGLEVIEAHWLFDIPFDKIDAVIHPQSIIHSMVEFIDGSIIAQMGVPDMRYPILYALAYPKRQRSDLRCSITDFPQLSFCELDPGRYPCFVLAREVAKAGGTAPAVLNAANEVAVGAFLAGRLPFGRIPEVIGSALAAVPRREATSLDDVFDADAETREWVRANYAITLPGMGPAGQEG
jgi:1-deoxy-D-xylulose-5-phosphate reductoisomerase